MKHLYEKVIIEILWTETRRESAKFSWRASYMCARACKLTSPCSKAIQAYYSYKAVFLDRKRYSHQVYVFYAKLVCFLLSKQSKRKT